MEDLIKQLSEVSVDSPAFDELMLRLEWGPYSDFDPGSIKDDEFDFSWHE